MGGQAERDGGENAGERRRPQDQPRHWTHRFPSLPAANDDRPPKLPRPRPRRIEQTLAFPKKTITVRSSTRGQQMTLSPPTALVFIASLILWALAVIGHFSQIPFITEHGFWVAVIAYMILAFGNLFRGL